MAVTVHIDFGAQENKICYCSHFSPSTCHDVCRANAPASWQFLLLPSCSLTGLSSLLSHGKRSCTLAIKSMDSGEFPGGLVWIWCFTAVVWVQSLVRELRSCKPHGVAREKRKHSLRCQTIQIQISALPFIRQKFLGKSPVLFTQFSSVQSLSHVLLFATPWTAARQASLSIINSQSLLKLMPIELVMPSNHLILCRPLLLLPSIFPSIRVF